MKPHHIGPRTSLIFALPGLAAAGFFISRSLGVPNLTTETNKATDESIIVKRQTPLPGFETIPDKSELLNREAGRSDPFAPIASPSDADPITVLEEPEDVDQKDFDTQDPQALAFTGFVKNGSSIIALVNYAGSSGEVAIGDVGGKSTPFLPLNWKLLSINTKNGEVALINIETRRRAFLSI